MKKIKIIKIQEKIQIKKMKIKMMIIINQNINL